MLRQRDKNATSRTNSPILAKISRSFTDSNVVKEKQKYGLCAFIIVLIVVIYWIAFINEDSQSTVTSANPPKQEKEVLHKRITIDRNAADIKHIQKTIFDKKINNFSPKINMNDDLTMRAMKNIQLRKYIMNHHHQPPPVLPEKTSHLSSTDAHKSYSINLSNKDHFGIVKEKSLSINIPQKLLPSGGTIFIRYTQPPSDITMEMHDFILVFLHGRKYNSETWSEMGTLHELAQKGYTCVAIDMPYFGQSMPNINVSNVSKMGVGNDWLIFVIKYLLNPPTSPFNIVPKNPFSELNYVSHKSMTRDEKLQMYYRIQILRSKDKHTVNTSGVRFRKFILITPSMSGRYSMPMLAGDTKYEMEQQLEPFSMIGCVTIAPIDTEKISVQNFKNVEIPVEIIYGELDKGLGLQSLSKLKHIPNHRIDMIEGSDHATYMNNQSLFQQIIVKYLNEYFSSKIKISPRI